jgi:eukaryotic-like serine/threonine-protein kinase
VTRTLTDRYELGPVVGAGGSAKVYAGRDLLLDRRVAVKVLDDQRAVTADPAARTRFLQEAQSAARFVHPHAVAVYDAGHDDGCLFIVMELIDGPTLAEHIARRAPLPEVDVMRIGTQLLEVLGAAHAVGLVHRDVKPANVLLDDAGNAHLADFGIAKRFDELSDSMTADGMVIGTPNYLAPEQAAGHAVTPAADLYAVGVVLHEMSTGIRPPVGSVDPRVLRPDLSEAIATTVVRSLATDPMHRFESAESMAAALRGRSIPTMVAPVPTEATTRATAGASNPTRILPASMTPNASRSRWIRPVATLLGVAVIVAGAATLVFALDDRSDADEEPGDSITVTPTTVPSTTVPPTTVPPTTVPPTTVLPTTVLPTTVPVTVVPGFPVTGDVEQFIAQLENDRDIAGRNTKRLADGLRKLIDDGGPTQDEVDELANDIEEWVDDGRLDERIGIAALDLIAGIPVDVSDDD